MSVTPDFLTLRRVLLTPSPLEPLVFWGPIWAPTSNILLIPLLGFRDPSTFCCVFFFAIISEVDSCSSDFLSGGVRGLVEIHVAGKNSAEHKINKYI